MPIVVVDFNAQTVDRHTQSVKIFSQLAGTEARAEKLAKEYSDGINEIQQRVAKAQLTKPRIYIEFGNKGPQEYSFTFGNNMWVRSPIRLVAIISAHLSSKTGGRLILSNSSPQNLRLF